MLCFLLIATRVWGVLESILFILNKLLCANSLLIQQYTVVYSRLLALSTELQTRFPMSRLQFFVLYFSCEQTFILVTGSVLVV